MEGLEGPGARSWGLRAGVQGGRGLGTGDQALAMGTKGLWLGAGGGGWEPETRLWGWGPGFGDGDWGPGVEAGAEPVTDHPCLAQVLSRACEGAAPAPPILCGLLGGRGEPGQGRLWDDAGLHPGGPRTKWGS